MASTIIVGGGLGGLAAAVGIARGGHEVTVLERADRFAEIGAGIQLAPNGIHALAGLGLGDAVHTTAVRMDELRLADGVTGEHVASLPLTEDYQHRFGSPYVVVHRAELHRLLVEACAASPLVRLRAGATVTGYAQTASAAAAILEGGEHVWADAVIGADGIRSAIRSQLVRDGEPRVIGISVYRSVVPMHDIPEELRYPTSVCWWTGPGCHLVHYPIAGGRLLNIAPSKETGIRDPIAGAPVRGDEVRRELSALGETAHRILALGKEWRTWALVDRAPVDTWHDGRVVLLGDAAHPMLHYVAQGACQAFEDAFLISTLLDGPVDDFPGRFEAFTAQRRDRTARIQALARASTRLWHPRGPAATTRNAALSHLTADQLHDHVAWLHEAQNFAPSSVW
jgi:3-hydroxybenzoate 6-monooxygenase